VSTERVIREAINDDVSEASDAEPPKLTESTAARGSTASGTVDSDDVE
jgi:hypothetical protein